MDNKKPITYGIEADMHLLSLLRTKNGERFSKLEAFCDLIGRMPDTIAKEKGLDAQKYLPFKSDTFRATITELADKWHWHRATVRSFLDGLEELGYLSKKLDGKEYIFTVRTFTNVAVPLANTDQLRVLVLHLVFNRRLYNLTDLQLSVYFELYINQMVSRTSGMSEEVFQKEVVEAKVQLLVNALKNLDNLSGRLSQNMESVLPLVRSTFDNEKEWPWEKWMAGLKFLNAASSYKKFPDSNIVKYAGSNESIELSGFTDKDIEILRSLHRVIRSNLTLDGSHKQTSSAGSEANS